MRGGGAGQKCVQAAVTNNRNHAKQLEERAEESRRCLASLVEPAAFGVSVRQRGGAAGTQQGGGGGGGLHKFNLTISTQLRNVLPNRISRARFACKFNLRNCAR